MKTTYKKLTYEDLEQVIEDLQKEQPQKYSDWCKPISPGLYKTGDMIHGETMKKLLEESLKEEFKDVRTHDD